MRANSGDGDEAGSEALYRLISDDDAGLEMLRDLAMSGRLSRTECRRLLAQRPALLAKRSDNCRVDLA